MKKENNSFFKKNIEQNLLLLFLATGNAVLISWFLDNLDLAIGVAALVFSFGTGIQFLRVLFILLEDLNFNKNKTE